MTEFDIEPELSSGSGPTDTHQAMNALFAQVLVEAARRRQDELPGLMETLQDQVLFTSGGTGRRAHGWFQAQAWQQHDRPVHELFINADFAGHDDWISLAENVLVTLLHEACHVYAEANNIKDTSRDGRYHNRAFAEIALQVGLQVERHVQWGHHTPRLNASGRYDYNDLLAQLETGLVLTRSPRFTEPAEGPEPTGKPPEVTTVTASPTSKYVFPHCDCQIGRSRATIRVARGSWEVGVIQCRRCGNAFEESLTTGRQERTEPSETRGQVRAT